MESIHFFRASSHTTGGRTFNFSERDLAAIAAAYDPRTHEAPIVVGHPKTDAPAYGWIERIVAKPDGLHAVPRQVNPEFAELVKQGSYKKVSAAFYPKNAPNNPKPGQFYLRHVGFLGAEPPAVKGLTAVQFSESEDMFFAEEDMLSLREHALNTRERALRRAEIDAAIKNAQEAGRIPIGLMPGVLAFAESLTQTGTIEFSEEGETMTFSQAEWFADFVSKLPIPVVTDELVGAEFAEDDTSDLELPEGYSTDPTAAALDRAARAHMRQHGGTYIDAVKHAQARLR